MPTPIMCLANFLIVLIVTGIAIAGIAVYFSPINAMAAFGMIVVAFVVGYQYIGDIVYSKPKKNDRGAIVKSNQVLNGK